MVKKYIYILAYFENNNIAHKSFDSKDKAIEKARKLNPSRIDKFE